MRIEVVSTVDEIRQEQIRNRVVIVIDVLRAASSIVTALVSGAREVIPVETTGQALALRTHDTILVGERYCRKIPEFDYNNSPTALLTANLQGKQLVLTTTNGTQAIQKAEKAHALLIGCFLNAKACITHALSHQLDITLYCAGSRGVFALEDGLAAGLMIHYAKQLAPQFTVCDMGEMLLAGYLYLADRLVDVLPHTATGKRLVKHQFDADIRYCARQDCVQLVPQVKEKRILPLLVS